MRRGVVRALIVALAGWLTGLLPAAAGPALLFDATTRQVLYAEDVDHPWFPASLTKLMTAYLVFEAWKSKKVEPTGTLTISARANSRPKMRLGLGAGKSLTFEEAMNALILLSANDIAVALAEAIAGSEAAFVDEMNAKAVRLGMASTRFINANGLPGEGQYSTARDLAVLVQAILLEFPEHAGLFSTTSALVKKRVLSTHNPVLIRLAGGDGMKTGFTCSAGYNIVASATRGGIKLVAIVFGEDTPAKREVRTTSLLEHGFRTLEWKALFPVTTLDTLPVETFDAGEVQARNLAKRFKDCQAPEPEVDADGNPVCPLPKLAMGGKSDRAVQAIKSMKNLKIAKGVKAKPDPCAPIIADKAKSLPARPVRMIAKRAAVISADADRARSAAAGFAAP